MIDLETTSRVDIEAHQLARLQEGLSRILTLNRFYREKIVGSSADDDALTMTSLEDLSQLPFTTKQELVEDQYAHPPFGSNLTYPLSDYVRLHQTSGTMTGQSLKVLDTQESWDWFASCWLAVYQSAGLRDDDVMFLAFSFGPLIGFWSAYEGAKRLGALTVPGGGMDSLQRLRTMQSVGATVLLATPGHALHLAEVAHTHDIDIQHSSIRVLVLAGEPGASIPATRERIERAWGAVVYDNVGMTEVGCYGYSCAQQQGMHVNESEFIAEILDPCAGHPVNKGEIGELVLTNLGRWGSPVIRYRSGDLVRHGGYNCACGRNSLFLKGGVLGRADDMFTVRGVHLYPSAFAEVLHRFPEVGEYKLIVTRNDVLDEVVLQMECPRELVSYVQEELHVAFSLSIPIEAVEPGSLPRFELKSRRVEDRRKR